MNHFVNHLWTILSKLVMQIMPNVCGFPSILSVLSTLEVAEEQCRGAQVFQKCRSHLKIHGTRRVAWNNLHIEKSVMLGTTTENFFGYFHIRFEFSFLCCGGQLFVCLKGYFYMGFPAGGLFRWQGGRHSRTSSYSVVEIQSKALRNKQSGFCPPVYSLRRVYAYVYVYVQSIVTKSWTT